MKINANIVERIELMVLKALYKDARKLYCLLCSRKVLSNFNLSKRAWMWRWLCDYNSVIPSLRTFFRDVEYLKECGNVMKLLVTFSKTVLTVRQALQYCYNPEDALEQGCLIQTSEDTFERWFASRKVQLELLYQQLWLYAMRVYPRALRSLTTPNSAKSQKAQTGLCSVFITTVLTVARQCRRLGPAWELEVPGDELSGTTKPRLDLIRNCV